MKIYFFPNGNTAVLDGESQVSWLQRSWIRMFFTFLEKEGIDPTQQEYHLPDGRRARCRKQGKEFVWEIYFVDLVNSDST